MATGPSEGQRCLVDPAAAWGLKSLCFGGGVRQGTLCGLPGRRRSRRYSLPTEPTPATSRLHGLVPSATRWDLERGTLGPPRTLDGDPS